jgi:hypothetical protein
MEITKELVFIVLGFVALFIVLIVPNFRIKIFGFFSAQGKESKNGNVSVNKVEGQAEIEITESVHNVKGDYIKGKPVIKINPSKKDDKKN